MSEAKTRGAGSEAKAGVQESPTPSGCTAYVWGSLHIFFLKFLGLDRKELYSFALEFFLYGPDDFLYPVDFFVLDV